MFFKKSRRIAFGILGFLIFANIIAYIAVFNLSQNKFLEVSFFDVGQGDAALIETPNKNQILIDGGPDYSVLSQLSKELPFYDRSIDLIILSHPDSDHLFGFLEILNRYDVKNILWTGYKKNTPEFKEWEEKIKTEGANIVFAQAGQRIFIQDNPLIFIDILYASDLKSLNSNDSSIVCRLVFENRSFLFMGDATEKSEQNILGLGKSDIIKIGHHGSKDSTSLKLLQAVSPKAAIISVGENNYGHPSGEVLEKLKNSDIDVLRTDKLGTIKFVSDGSSLKSFNYK